MSYESTLEYIHSVQWRGSRPGLSRTIQLLSLIGDPHKKLRFVHVAGTNGKGSTSAMIESVLRSAGYKTGLYTSPYINRFNERMRVGGADISDAELEELTDFVRPYADAMSDPPTEFELITAIAMEFFMRHGCDIVVLEVGMGGELDSTNVIDTPEVAAITAIGLDHTRELGSTLAEIAKAKAGIFKGGRAVAYGCVPDADAVLKRRAEETGTALTFADFSELNVKEESLGGSVIDIGEIKDIHMPLVGAYQPYNAALAVTALRLLRENGYTITDDDIRRGLETVLWPGRFEVLSREPVFVLDGAHNGHGMAAAAESIRRLLGDVKPVAVIGAMADKDVEKMLELIAPLVKCFVAVRPDNPRAMAANELAVRASKIGVSARAFDSVYEGVSEAVRIAGGNGAVCALGSLYFSADIRDAAERLRAEGLIK